MGRFSVLFHGSHFPTVHSFLGSEPLLVLPVIRESLTIVFSIYSECTDRFNLISPVYFNKPPILQSDALLEITGIILKMTEQI
jgi:hypothetical protein